MKENTDNNYNNTLKDIRDLSFNNSILNNKTFNSLSSISTLTDSMRAFSNSILQTTIDNSPILNAFNESINFNSLSSISSFTDSMKAFSNSILKVSEYNSNLIYETISVLSNELLEMNDINLDDFDINSYDSSTIEDAAKLVNETLIINENKENNLNWQQQINEKCKAFSEKNPVYSFFIKGILNWLLFSIIFANIMTNTLTTLKTSFNKVINSESEFNINDAQKECIKKVYDKSLLNRFRYINRNNVNIRISPKMNSLSLVTVNTGDIVELVYKYDKKQRKKNWIHVIYTDKNNNVYNGWINIAYTGMLNYI